MARALWLPPNTSRVGRSATRPSWRAAAARSPGAGGRIGLPSADRKSTRLNSSHGYISYAVFCLKKKRLYTTLLIFPVRVLFNSLRVILIHYLTILFIFI